MNQPDIINKSTRITFPQGDIQGLSKILLAMKYKSDSVILTEETPFHPISHSWPDQQADTGTISADGMDMAVVDALTGAINTQAKDFRLYLGKEIPIRKKEFGWVFVVAHIVELPTDETFEHIIGKDASLLVDYQRRRELSATHTATHLVAHALNKRTRNLWRKEVDKDTLGNPNLDKFAMQASEIMTSECVDHYRFGKSLRKAGFESDQFFEHINSIFADVNEQVNIWLNTGCPVIVKVAGPTLESERWWTCELDDREVMFPCGGTHVKSLHEIQSINVSYEIIPGLPEIKMRTVAVLRS